MTRMAHVACKYQFHFVVESLHVLTYRAVFSSLVVQVEKKAGGTGQSRIIWKTPVEMKAAVIHLIKVS